MQLNELTITQAAKGLRNKQFSAVELTKVCLDQIEKRNKDVNAFITVCQDSALKEAEEADKGFATGKDLPILAGIPCAIKDNFNTKGIRTTCASKILDNFVPTYDATSIKKLKEQGMVLLGKTNLDEYTCGASCEHSCFGPTKNPYDLDRISGGSSGGSAAAVADNMCLYSLGTDTGGSIRQPASFCNIIGLKVTYGRVSRFGVTSFASSLDTIGPLTKTVEDAAIVLQAIAGKDPLDSTTPDKEVPNYSLFLDKGIKGLRIGVPKEYFGEGIDNEIAEIVRKALKDLEQEGAILKEISLPMTKYGVALYYIIAPTELSANLGRFDGIRYGRKGEAKAEDLIEQYKISRGEGFGDEIKRRIMIGTYVSSAGYYDAYYKKAQKVRTLIIQDFNEAFEEVDVICGPASPIPPWKIGENENNPLAEYLADLMTIPASCAGITGMSVPCGKDSKELPVGLQILAPQFEEGRLFQVGRAYERVGR
ncbi:MAG: glutamyl-tRNA(Gln) amidotransferase subunit A, aspartyl-tRNA(Asn)/glutamyl-tRNA (Gln) amidotransferase subunit A [Candidatus Peregrinibacteria bacterium GW2011_GWF2_33_10]|nr:MAG: glutamyl-tRNA(Gln) amidotransferase subunit A, aspartyl-tRNA(Asn)/glutamyl-tRNA (Gln) amidotransferase subunit A [Candidatus Peregrinibacteria bacterium GW2011_GWF2_33_10]OGJ46312.1 MAG: aspartyl/glutamyl-tRNA amidotransferase subunit A [Candidatus Peregrinibacteria bacterium RIFOXYA12_FULL_33_12]